MPHPTEPPDSVPDFLPDGLATPEGDNEVLPNQPLTPLADDLERPRGNEPHPAQPIRPAEE